MSDAPLPISSPLTGLAAGVLTSVVTKSLTRESCEARRDRDEQRIGLAPPPASPFVLCSSSCPLILPFPTDPLDTLKAQLQVSAGSGTSPSTLATARAIWRTQGPAGFWRGLTATLVGAAPGSGAYFLGVEGGRAGCASLGLPPGPVTDAGVGVVAQLVGGLAFTPADVIRERVQAGPALAPAAAAAVGAASPRAALAAALRSGGVGGLLKGYWATNAVWLPWGALFFAGYGRLTAAAAARRREQTGGDGEDRRPSTPAASTLPAPTLAACAGAAAGGAAILTHPLDVVKTRLQVLSGCGGEAAASPLSARRVATALWASGGAAAFGAGLSARAAQLSLATALQWVTYEKARAWVEKGV